MNDIIGFKEDDLNDSGIVTDSNSSKSERYDLALATFFKYTVLDSSSKKCKFDKLTLRYSPLGQSS